EMYSFLRRPIWILSHVLIAILVAVLISLGFWQRSRYYEEKDRSDRLAAAAVATPLALDKLVALDDVPNKVPDTVRYKRVEVSGTYDVAHEVVVNNRSLDGAPGAWVLTPLVQADGTAVGVVRGWIPLSVTESGPPYLKAAPPEGTVSVLGNVQLTQERESFGPSDPKTGTLTNLSRVDLKRFGQQLPYDLEPVYVLLDTQSPPQPSTYPALISLQEVDSSQNFSYMMQWWIFALIAAGGYPLVLRMVARSKDPNRPGRISVPKDDEIPWAAGLGPDAQSEEKSHETSAEGTVSK
ncbi:MAG TPA: SURF1 family protein, partial [Microthrixaceae bacterium]|nr:SURF1 family protein [Microthrixaceae bacterium]